MFFLSREFIPQLYQMLILTKGVQMNYVVLNDKKHQINFVFISSNLLNYFNLISRQRQTILSSEDQ